MNLSNLNVVAAGVVAQVAAGVVTTADVAAKLGVTVQKVTGNLAVLKKHNLVTYAAGTLTLTEDGLKLVAVAKPAPASVTAAPGVSIKNKDRAGVIIEQMAGASRKDVIAAIMAELEVTANNASAYIQNYRAAHGLVTPRGKKVVA